jgi:hypothetical protein
LTAIGKNKNEIIIAITSVVAVLVVIYVSKKYLFGHKSSLKNIAKKDLKKWSGKTETSKDVSKDMVEYWKLAGLNFSPAQMQSTSVQSNYPWSSVYISHLVKSAGFKNFTPRTTHSGYTVDAKKNRANKKKQSYWAFKPSEGKKVEIGDIIVKGRSGTHPSLDTINSGVLTHGDIVVDVKKINGKQVAITQGGNVSNTVKQTQVSLSKEGKLVNTAHFAQLKYIS